MSNIKTITCLKELEERKELQLDDIVKFTIKEQIIEYRVKYNYLKNSKSSPGDNDKIFKVLNIDKNEIAEKGYKYKALRDGYWPCSEDNDFLALTRLVKELYLMIEERKPVYTKFTRFEIMEI